MKQTAGLGGSHPLPHRPVGLLISKVKVGGLSFKGAVSGRFTYWTPGSLWAFSSEVCGRTS